MKLLLEANREGYDTDQVGSTMTIRELIDYLEQYDDETPIFISNDRGYTYGAIRGSRIREAWDETEEPEDEDWEMEEN